MSVCVVSWQMRNDYYNHQTLLVHVIVHTQREGEREGERERGRDTMYIVNERQTLL